MIITIPANIFNVVPVAAAKSAWTRHFLQGVFFDQRGYLVATNGQILAAGKIHWSVEDEREFVEIVGDRRGIIIPQPTVTAFQKAIKSVKPESVELHYNGKWSLVVDSVSMTFTPIDADYPHWDRIIPETTPAQLVPAHFDPKYIKALSDMSKVLTGKHGNYFINQNGHNAAVVQFHDHENFIAVLMPMRNNAPWEFNRDQFISPLID